MATYRAAPPTRPTAGTKTRKPGTGNLKPLQANPVTEPVHKGLVAANERGPGARGAGKAKALMPALRAGKRAKH